MIELNQDKIDKLIYEIPFFQASDDLTELLDEFACNKTMRDCIKIWAKGNNYEDEPFCSETARDSVLREITEQFDIKMDKDIFETLLSDFYTEQAEKEIINIKLSGKTLPPADDFFKKVTVDFLLWLDEKNDLSKHKKRVPDTPTYCNFANKSNVDTFETALGWLFEDLLEEQGKRYTEIYKDVPPICPSAAAMERFEKALCEYKNKHKN